MTDLRQVPEYARYMELLGWTRDKVRGVYIYSKNLPILGRIIKIQRQDKIIPINLLTEFIRKKRTFSTYIEPLNIKQFDYYMNNGGFKKSNSPNLPSKTITFDLEKGSKKLLSEMHYKTRYNIGLAIRRGIEIRRSEDIHFFSKFWHQSAKRRGFYFSLEKEITDIFTAFGKKAYILFAQLKDEIISAVLLIKADKSLHYMYAASSDIGNKNFAPTLLVWEAIRLAKKLKLKTFDFEGIYDERFPLKSWIGFTRFKKGFGGKEVEYPPTLRRFSLLINL